MTSVETFVLSVFRAQLHSYHSASTLHEKLESDFECIVNTGVAQLTGWFNDNVSTLAQGHDTWINSFLQDTYTELRERELQNWHQSELWKDHLFTSLVVGFGGLTGFAIAGWWGMSLLALILCPIVSFLIYKYEIQTCLTPETQAFTLETTDIALSSDEFKISISHQTPQEDTQGIGALGGAIVGGLQGGVGGAIAGLFLGGIAGGFFGEPLSELKARVIKPMNARFEAVQGEIIQTLNQQIPIVHEKLLNAIQQNYEKNKRRTIKLLMSSSDNTNTSWSQYEKEGIPIPKVNYSTILAYSGLVIGALILIGLMIHEPRLMFGR